MIDCGRADHFSIYNDSKNTTPNLKKIAAESMVYNNAISPAGWTLPTHSSIFTGVYPSQHGAHNENHQLSNEYPTLAELLVEQGYKTFGICTIDWLSQATGVIRGFQEFDNLHFSKSKLILKRMLQYPIIGGKDCWGYETNRKAKKWLKQNDSGNPFFMYLHYNELHLPYNIPEKILKNFLPEDVTVAKALKINQDAKKYYAGIAKMSAEDFKIHKALYDAGLKYTDDLIGQLIDFLRKQDILDNTILVITSDHGESLGEHGHFDHYYVLYESLLHVPLMVRYFPVFGSGKSDALVQTIDLYPTLLQLAGVPIEKYEHHAALTLPPVGKNKGREYAYAERFQDLKGLKESFKNHDLSHLEKYEQERLTVIRGERYKLIYSMQGRHELFDLHNDPREEENILLKEPGIAEIMMDKLKEWQSSFPLKQTEGEEAYFDKEAVERLKALGYLG